MAEPPEELEGWSPEPGEVPLDEIVDLAFDYRGNTTVRLEDGTSVFGYLYNRNADVAEPYVEIFPDGEDGSVRLPYAEIATIEFTGEDPAAY